jgi:hypothetical protein
MGLPRSHFSASVGASHGMILHILILFQSHYLLATLCRCLIEGTLKGLKPTLQTSKQNFKL